MLAFCANLWISMSYISIIPGAAGVAVVTATVFDTFETTSIVVVDEMIDSGIDAMLDTDDVTTVDVGVVARHIEMIE